MGDIPSLLGNYVLLFVLNLAPMCILMMVLLVGVYVAIPFYFIEVNMFIQQLNDSPNSRTNKYYQLNFVINNTIKRRSEAFYYDSDAIFYEKVSDNRTCFKWSRK